MSKNLILSINEGLNSNQLPIDYDILVVVEEELDKEKRKKLKESLNISSRIKKIMGIRNLDYIRDNFKVSVQIIPKNLIDENKCYLYQSNCPNFDKDELDQIRAFKLFDQRNGIYGGYNQSI